MVCRAIGVAGAGVLLLGAAAAVGPCGALGPYTLCAEAGAECTLVAARPEGSVIRRAVALPHPEACGLIGGTALNVVEVCGGLPATLVASPVPLAELGESLGGGFTHRQAQALVLVDSAGALRIGRVTTGAASRDAAIHAPDPKYLQIAAHAEGFCATGGAPPLPTARPVRP